jgi:hypothetical protein
MKSLILKDNLNILLQIIATINLTYIYEFDKRKSSIFVHKTIKLLETILKEII